MPRSDASSGPCQREGSTRVTGDTDRSITERREAAATTVAFRAPSAIPGPGGRWMPAVHHAPTGGMERLPSTRTLDEARDAAELARQRAMRTLAVADPARLDTTIATFARSGDYSRHELTVLVGPRLDEPDRQRLAIAPPGELIELLGAAGLSAAAAASQSNPQPCIEGKWM